MNCLAIPKVVSAPAEREDRVKQKERDDEVLHTSEQNKGTVVNAVDVVLVIVLAFLALEKLGDV